MFINHNFWREENLKWGIKPAASVYEPNALLLGHTGSHSHRKPDNHFYIHWVAGKAFVKFWPEERKKASEIKYFRPGSLRRERGKKYVKCGKGPKLCRCTMFHNFLSAGKVLGSERVKLRSQGFFPDVFLWSFPPHQCGIVVCCPVPWFMCHVVAVRWVELFVSCCTRCAVSVCVMVFCSFDLVAQFQRSLSSDWTQSVWVSELFRVPAIHFFYKW